MLHSLWTGQMASMLKFSFSPSIVLRQNSPSGVCVLRERVWCVCKTRRENVAQNNASTTRDTIPTTCPRRHSHKRSPTLLTIFVAVICAFDSPFDIVVGLHAFWCFGPLSHQRTAAVERSFISNQIHPLPLAETHQPLFYARLDHLSHYF